MKHARHALNRQTLCVALMAVLLLNDEAIAETRSAASRDKTNQASLSTTAAGRPRSKTIPTARMQVAVLRYTSLPNLPRRVSSEFHSEARNPADDAADTPEARCARGAPGNPSSSGEKISPCLGLYRGGEPASPVTFHFDLALKSIGAPKDILFGQCVAGSNSSSCNSRLSEANVEQERLADTLSRQHRYPVATLGVAVSF